jgi:hypothetical protein
MQEKKMSASETEGKTPPSPPLFVYQIKVVLIGITPPIWRRFHVASNITFYDLHCVLQIVMGWGNYHLYQFVASGIELSDSVTAAELGIRSAEQMVLGQLVHNSAARFVYEYDFGARWEHELLLEKQMPLVGQRPLPICLAGERACPPEGSGGSQGYTRFLESLRERTRPMYLTKQTHIVPPFRPEIFDLNRVNANLSTWR